MVFLGGSGGRMEWKISKRRYRRFLTCIVASGLYATTAVVADDAVAQSDVVPVAVQLTGPAAEVEVFMNGFFERFAKFSKARRGSSQDRAMIPLLRHTKSNFDSTPAIATKDVPVDPSLGLISKLWIHGPESWQIAEMEVEGNTAYAKVFFQSIQSGRPDPIPFGLKFYRAQNDWKIVGYVDMRAVPSEGLAWQQLFVVKNDVSPEAVFSDYMEKIEHYYAPSKARESMKITPQVQQNLSPLWAPTQDALKSSSRAIMAFSQIQPRNWQFVSSDLVDENAELVIKASAGNPVMRRNMGMAAMMGSGLKFTLEKAEERWLLMKYSRARSK
ncbi:hypothetical protein [Kordiimonas aquimaris]|uniref:hypothetical protein n=1 Tax=Kordiimonas aquimaris TaxID=707591 RepID=UPI0021CFE1D2|nr:hypothetical protein [Kordiimonas aquimaris]